MASDDDLSDLSSLSSLSPVPSDDEIEEINDEVPGKAVKGTGILNYFPKVSERLAREPSPPPRRRSASPTHEYVLADNPDIAVSWQSVNRSLLYLLRLRFELYASQLCNAKDRVPTS